MGFSTRFRKIKFISPERLLEIYPPFLFMGVKVTHSAKDFRKLVVRLPLRWYGRNQYGSMFGGFMCAVADPLPALLCSKIFEKENLIIWTKSNAVNFVRPGQTSLDYVVTVTEDDVVAIRKALELEGRVTHLFEFPILDQKRQEVAHVRNEVYLRRK